MLFHRWALMGAIRSFTTIQAATDWRGWPGPVETSTGRSRSTAGSTTPGIDCPWTSVLEPRFVLEVARLLDQKGDQAGAREEYERFLGLWKNADPGLPELAEARTRLAELEALS